MSSRAPAAPPPCARYPTPEKFSASPFSGAPRLAWPQKAQQTLGAVAPGRDGSPSRPSANSGEPVSPVGADASESRPYRITDIGRTAIQEMLDCDGPFVLDVIVPYTEHVPKPPRAFCAAGLCGSAALRAPRFNCVTRSIGDHCRARPEISRTEFEIFPQPISFLHAISSWPCPASAIGSPCPRRFCARSLQLVPN